MDKLLKELNHRWNAMFSALAAGDDAPPALRLRAEGMMEAAVVLGASADDVVQAMEQCYVAAFGSSIAADFGNDWRDFYPFPQIPAVGRRAPVYPSTSE